jgi:hypothetical protein
MKLAKTSVPTILNSRGGTEVELQLIGTDPIRRLQWEGTNANWADTNWLVVSIAGAGYQDYYDLDDSNISAPQAGTIDGVNLYDVGSRLRMATIRNGLLWTCQTVGLSGTNGTYTGNASGTNVDRSAAQWLKLQINSDGSGLTLADHGRVFDLAPSNAWWYYFPSLAVNCPGDMVMGLSGSSSANYIGAFYTWRLAGGATLDLPQVIQPGTTNFGGLRWGDYSATTVDPSDDWSFWTVQEYATVLAGPLGNIAGRWGTVIARIRPDP